MKKTQILRLLILIAGLLGTTTLQAAFKGAGKPVEGKEYYLYNVYQGKFLSYGNAEGTQLSLVPFGDSRVLKCTLEKTGAGYNINTHYSAAAGGWQSDADNYVSIADGIPYADSGSRTPTKFFVSASDEGCFVYASVSSYLMFDAGTACTVGRQTVGFNADKALWRFIDEEEYAGKLSQKMFTAVAMNVDGMPRSIKIAGFYELKLNPDGKEAAGATAIGQKLVGMGYDFIGVSEDFNYDNEIRAQINGVYSGGTHRGGITVTASTYMSYLAKKTLFDTDGLNLFWRTDGISVEGESWTAWTAHNGYTEDGADGLINKGFRYYCVTLPDGKSQVDVYIHHMDAEITEGDLAARESQLNQLVSYIKNTHNGRPIIVMGDTNCRYTRDRLKELFIDTLNDDPRFTCRDPWIDFGREGLYPAYGSSAIMAADFGYRQGEVVDKLFYINNTESDIRIEAETYTQDLSFVYDAGEPLADHWPCAVLFTYRDYDPDNNDDETPDEGGWKQVYLRNVGTQDFLKTGGWWGTHATLGHYGTPVDILPVGDKYVIQTGIGGGYLNGTDPYMDQTVFKWTLTEKGDAYMILTDGNALCAGAYDAYGPNTYTVGTTASNDNDNRQLWEIVTAEDLKQEMLSATSENPYDCTFLIRGANFDRNDIQGQPVSKGGAWECTVTDDARQMTYSFGDGAVDLAHGNPVAEIYNRSFSVGSYESTWEVRQTLTGLPAGLYRITCQGFYRDGDLDQNNPGTLHASLFASPKEGEEQSVPLRSMYEPQCTSALSATRDADGYYVPNGMADATYFFNAGYYRNTVEAEVEQEELTLGVRKAEKTSSTSGWTCFDNFRLFYLGPVEEIPDGIYVSGEQTVAADKTPVFDLSGRRVSGTLSRGLYIRAGQKVVKH